MLVPWPATDSPIPESDMARLFDKAEQIHKWAHYIPFYEEKFSPYRHQYSSLLEIGVDRGGSLDLWAQYFDDATIVGIDHLPECARFDDPVSDVHVRIGGQQDIGFLESLLKEFGAFDIIIDDGSHIPSYTLRSFWYLFPRMADGGVYIVEDLAIGYIPGAPDRALHDVGQGLSVDDFADDGSPPFAQFAKHLVDVMHAVYPLAAQEPGPQLENAFRVGQPERVQEFRVPLLTTLVSRIDFRDGIVAIHRGPRELPRSIYK
jgi:hypothetical protein